MTEGPWDLNWYTDIWIACSECEYGRCYPDGDGEHYACDLCHIVV